LFLAISNFGEHDPEAIRARAVHIDSLISRDANYLCLCIGGTDTELRVNGISSDVSVGIKDNQIRAGLRFYVADTGHPLDRLTAGGAWRRDPLLPLAPPLDDLPRAHAAPERNLAFWVWSSAMNV
jgi:hypothetical protein